MEDLEAPFECPNLLDKILNKDDDVMEAIVDDANINFEKQKADMMHNLGLPEQLEGIARVIYGVAFMAGTFATLDMHNKVIKARMNADEIINMVNSQKGNLKS